MNIVEKIKDIVNNPSCQEEQGGKGGPFANSKLGAEAEIVVRGPDGKIKSTHKANKTVITL